MHNRVGRSNATLFEFMIRSLGKINIAFVKARPRIYKRGQPSGHYSEGKRAEEEKKTRLSGPVLMVRV